MPITIPNRAIVRLTTDFTTPNNGHALPNAIATNAITNPGPVAIDPNNGPTSSGQAQVIQAAGGAGSQGYIGYNPDPSIPAGGPVSACRNVIVEGFAGVINAAPVYIDATSADNTPTSSGLTHTPQGWDAGTVTAELAEPEVTATSTFEIVVPPGATSLSGFELTSNAATAASNTNYFTVALANLGNSSAAMLAAAPTGVNSTQVTGGTAVVAGTPWVATLVNQVEALVTVDSTGSGTFTLTIAGVATGAIAYSATIATLITNINAALNTTFGASQIVASGASLAALVLTFSGSNYAGTTTAGHVTVTLLAGATGFVMAGSSGVGAADAGTSTTSISPLANLAVTPGQVLTLTITLTGSGVTLGSSTTGLNVQASFTSTTQNVKQIGVGWTAPDRIFFY